MIILLFWFVCFLFYTANVGCLGQGCGVGWLSPSLPILMSNESPLKSGTITTNEAGWIGSILSLGAVLGTLCFGLLTNVIGTKKSMMACIIPTLVIFFLR